MARSGLQLVQMLLLCRVAVAVVQTVHCNGLPLARTKHADGYCDEADHKQPPNQADEDDESVHAFDERVRRGAAGVVPAGGPVGCRVECVAHHHGDCQARIRGCRCNGDVCDTCCCSNRELHASKPRLHSGVDALQDARRQISHVRRHALSNGGQHVSVRCGICDFDVIRKCRGALQLPVVGYQRLMRARTGKATDAAGTDDRGGVPASHSQQRHRENEINGRLKWSEDGGESSDLCRRRWQVRRC